MKVFNSKIGAVVAGAFALVVLGGIGGATAGGLVTSASIKDHTIRGIDIHEATIDRGDLTPALAKAIASHAKPGVKGDTGATGPQGATGATGPQGPKGDPGTNGTDGKDGAPGVNGKDGKDGANGVSGYEVRSWDYDTVSGGGIATMTCPVGKIAVGGGYRYNDDAAMTNGTTVVASYPGVMDWNTNKPKVTGDPLVDDRGWIVQANKPQNVNPGAMTVFVVCETAPAANVG